MAFLPPNLSNDFLHFNESKLSGSTAASGNKVPVNSIPVASKTNELKKRLIPESKELEKEKDFRDIEKGKNDDVKIIIREVPMPKTWFPRDLLDVDYWCGLVRGLFLISIFVILLLQWSGVPSPLAPSAPTTCCDIPKCTYNSDIPTVNFVAGVYNIVPVCYKGSSQIIYYPPTDSLNFDFGSASLEAATFVCQAAIAQKFSCPPSINPYMANNANGTATGIYNACSLVFECSFKKYVSF